VAGVFAAYQDSRSVYFYCLAPFDMYRRTCHVTRDKYGASPTVSPKEY